MTTTAVDPFDRAQAGDDGGERLNPIDGLIEIGRTVQSEETRAELAKLPSDYFERFRYYANAPTRERGSDSE